MKRIVALLTSAVALAACSSPTAPSPDAQRQVEQAKSSLQAASKVSPNSTTGRIALN